MKRWQIYGAVSASKYIGEVEAETEEQAMEKGWKLPEAQGCSVCHQCANEVEDPEITAISASILEDVR